MHGARGIAAVLVGLAATVAGAAEVHDVRLWRAPDHTRIVFDLTAPAEHKLMVLENPDRIVVDIQGGKTRLGWLPEPIDVEPAQEVGEIEAAPELLADGVAE